MGDCKSKIMLEVDAIIDAEKYDSESIIKLKSFYSDIDGKFRGTDEEEEYFTKCFLNKEYIVRIKELEKANPKYTSINTVDNMDFMYGSKHLKHKDYNKLYDLNDNFILSKMKVNYKKKKVKKLFKKYKKFIIERELILTMVRKFNKKKNKHFYKLALEMMDGVLPKDILITSTDLQESGGSFGRQVAIFYNLMLGEYKSMADLSGDDNIFDYEFLSSI